MKKKRKAQPPNTTKPVSPAFGIEFPGGYKPIQNICTLSIDEPLQNFFREFIRQRGF